jgi:hypothetical protein
MRVAFKPTSTIGQLQETVTRGGVEETNLRGKGRHDPCVLPRAVPIVEAMVNLVLVDALLCQHGQCELMPRNANLQAQQLFVPNNLGKKLDYPYKQSVFLTNNNNNPQQQQNQDNDDNNSNQNTDDSNQDN